MGHRTLKLLFVYFSLVSLLFTSYSTVASAASTPAAISITDIKKHWAEATITKWISKGFTKGYADSTFKPDNSITRAEFFALVNRSFGFTAMDPITFSDVKDKDWYHDDVAKAIKAKYILGDGSSSIGAARQITRQEVAVIIAKLINLQPASDNPASDAFSDADQIAPWSKDAIDAVAGKKIMNGYKEDRSFKPTKSISRAESLFTLEQAINFQDNTYDKAGTYGPATGVKTIDSNVTINAPGVTLQNMIINGNLTLSDKIGDGDVYIKNTMVKGTTTINGGGVNSIHLINSVIDSVVVDKQASPVRVVAEGASRVTNVVVQSSAIIEEDSTIKGVGFQSVKLQGASPADSTVTLKGSFDKLDVNGSKITVNITSGTVQQMVVSDQAVNNTLNLSANVVLASLSLDTTLKVTGQGTIMAATLSENAQESSFDKQPTMRKDKNGAVLPPLAAPAFTSVVASNTGNNVGLGVGDSIVITFNQNTNKPSISAANLNTWLVISSGHSFGTSLANQNISWNDAGNILTIYLSSISGTTFTVGDTVRVMAAANLKNSFGSTEASTAISGASAGSFTSPPTISSVIAADTGRNLDRGVGDSVSITFNQNTNRQTMRAASLNSSFVLSNGHSFGTGLSDRDIQWNATGNILTITFSNLTGNTFAVGDTVTVTAAANIRDSSGKTEPAASTSSVSSGDFTTYLEVKSVVVSNTGNNMGLGVGDSIAITFNVNTNHPTISAANLKTWFNLTSGHSFGTNIADGNIAWNGAGNILTITLSDVTGTTFTVGDYIMILGTANIKDTAGLIPVSTILSPPSTGSFTFSPSIVSVVAANTGNNVGLGIGDRVTITFDQNTNKPFIPASSLNTWLIPSGGRSFGPNLANSDIEWNAAGNVLTITFSNVKDSTFTVGSNVTISAAANIKDVTGYTAASTSVSPASTGTFTSSPLISSIAAVNSNNTAGLGTGDTVVITFNQSTNHPPISSANIDTWLTLNDGHSFGSNATASWNPAGNILTIRFNTIPDIPFAIGDRITILAEAGLKDSLGTSPASTAVSVSSTGSFSTPPKIIKVEAKNDGANIGLGANDTVTITLDLPTNKPFISGPNMKDWFTISSGHSFGTLLHDGDAAWDGTGTILTIKLSNVTGTTFAVGDTVSLNNSVANIRDAAGEGKVSDFASPVSIGSFTSAPEITQAYFTDPVPSDGVLGDSDTLTFVFDQHTNKPVISSANLQRWFILSTNHRFGSIKDVDIVWSSVDDAAQHYDQLTITFNADVSKTTVVFGDTVKIEAAANIKDVTGTSLASTSVSSPISGGN